jgi:ABC-2 type transport system ATP-binding protein
MPDVLLDLAGVSQRFGRTWALQNVDLTIRQGQRVGLFGPNGAGKTTLLRIMAGHLIPTQGSVVANPQRRLSFVPPAPALYPGFTVADMLEAGRRLNRVWDGAHGAERMDRYGIAMHKRCRELSTGQKAQLALALALSRQPDVVVLDEPLAALDPLARRQFVAELRADCEATGRTVVVSSHDILDLDSFCSHAVVLNRGRLVVAADVTALQKDEAGTSHRGWTEAVIEHMARDQSAA